MTIENKPASRLEKYLHYIATKEGEIPEEVGSRLELYLKAICERLSTEGGGTSITVENVLTSTSTANALSSAQGKVLNDKIAALEARVSALETPGA